MRFRRLHLLSILRFAVTAIVICGPMFAGTFSIATIPGNANIFAAGQVTPFSGTLPPSVTFTGSNLVLTFSSVTGLVNCCSGAPDSPPDGGSGAGGTTDLNSKLGISGIIDSAHTLFLVGVFDNGSTNAGAAPARLDFSPGQLTENFASLSPALYQTFYIGNGLVGASGPTQQFLVPAGATRLFLGFADGGGFHGNPAYYEDNRGSLSADFSIDPQNAVPEPSTLALAGMAALAMAALRTRRARP